MSQSGRMRLPGPRVWLAVLVWVVLLVVLNVALVLLGIGSTVFGGALGAYCGATLVVLYVAWERAQKRSREPDPLAERYGR